MIKSALKVLQEYFGPLWYLITFVVIPVIILLPVAIFWNHISFDPATFTEEWIKMGVAGLIVFLLIEIISHHRSVFMMNQASTRFLNTHYLIPLKVVYSQMKQLLSSESLSEVSDLKVYKELGTEIRHHWKYFDVYSELNITSLAPDPDLGHKIYWVIQTMNVPRCRNIINTCTVQPNPSDPQEIEELLKRISQCISDLEELGAYPKTRQKRVIPDPNTGSRTA